MCPDPVSPSSSPSSASSALGGKLPTALLNRCDFKFKAEVTDLDPKAFKGKGMLPCLTV